MRRIWSQIGAFLGAVAALRVQIVSILAKKCKIAISPQTFGGFRRDVSNYFDQVSIIFDFDTSCRTFDGMCQSQIIETLAQ